MYWNKQGRTVFAKISLTFLSLVLAAVCLPGCNRDGQAPETTQSGQPDAGGHATDVASAAELNREAEQAYRDFLDGKTSLNAQKEFAAKWCAFADAGETASYDIGAMKAALLESSGEEGLRTRYAIADIAEDGVNELLLSFEYESSGEMWTGIIKYENKALNLKYNFTGGYRTEAAVYLSGYLVYGGAVNAFTNSRAVAKFDGNIVLQELHSAEIYSGSATAMIAEALGGDGKALMAQYEEPLRTSSLHVWNYLDKEQHIISAENWSEDATVYASEKALVEELVKLGAKEVSQQETDAIFSRQDITEGEPAWTLLP